jgi:hypothetical protein
MKIDIKRVLADHYKVTGEYITQKSLAEEMVNARIFKNVHSAQNMIQYNISGKAKSLDVDMLEFLCKRFNKTLIDIIY